MKKTILPASLLVFFAAGIQAQVVVNEYSCANLSQYQDDYGKFEDWIELYNTSGASADIGGFYLSDNENKPTKWQFPSGVNIPAHGFLKVYASGRNEVMNGNSFHTNFKLTQTKNSPEHLVLADPAGTIINDQTSNQYQYLTLASAEEEPSWPLIDEAKPALALTQEALYGYTEPISQALALDFKFTDLNTIQHQNGWSGLTVIRNQNLLGSTAEDQQTNPLFVYQTPLTLFANKITPLLSLDTLAPLTPNPAQGTPLAQLTQALADFFSALFDGAPAGTVFQIRTGCQYAFAVTATDATTKAQLQALQDANALTTNLPLLLVPVAAFNPASDANPQNPESFVAQLAQATLANAATVGVADKDGMPLVAGLYLFEVSAYSSLGTGSGTVASQPMLDINNRYWAVGLSLT